MIVAEGGARVKKGVAERSFRRGVVEPTNVAGRSSIREFSSAR